MKKLSLFGAALLIAGSSMIFSCKKDKKEDIVTNDTSEATVTSDAQDESDVQSSEDEISDDVNVAIDASSSISGRYSAGACQGTASVDTSAKTITITYDGTTCLLTGRKKTGTVIVQLIRGNHWSEEGAKITVSTNLTITKGDKSIIINGAKTIVNETGRLVKDLTTGSLPIIHKIHGSFEVTFPNSTKRTWEVARKITFSKEGSVKFIEISGDTTINGESGIVMWGTNRRGESFKNIINTTIEANSACGWDRPTSGVRTHVGGKTFTATFGLDDSGAPITSGCATKFKIEWTNNSGEHKSATILYN